MCVREALTNLARFHCFKCSKIVRPRKGLFSSVYSLLPSLANIYFIYYKRDKGICRCHIITQRARAAYYRVLPPPHRRCCSLTNAHARMVGVTELRGHSASSANLCALLARNDVCFFLVCASHTHRC